MKKYLAFAILAVVALLIAQVPKPGSSSASAIHMAQMTRDSAQSINTGAATKIAFDNVAFDTGAIADATTNDRFTVARSGKYLISASWGCPNLDPNEDLWITVYKNGSELRRTTATNGPGTNSTAYATLSTVDQLAAGDLLEMYVTHFEGASQNTLTTADGKPTMAIVELQ